MTALRSERPLRGRARLREPEARGRARARRAAAAAPAAADAAPARVSEFSGAQARSSPRFRARRSRAWSDVLIVRFEGASLFESSSAELVGRAVRSAIASLARALADEPRERIIVRGHTDGQRDERSSQTLSEELADSVRNFLVAEGVLPSRITAVGLAASQPVATNATEEGRQQNRRIEIELWPEPELTQGGGPQ